MTTDFCASPAFDSLQIGMSLLHQSLFFPVQQKWLGVITNRGGHGRKTSNLRIVWSNLMVTLTDGRELLQSLVQNQLYKLSSIMLYWWLILQPSRKAGWSLLIMLKLIISGLRGKVPHHGLMMNTANFLMDWRNMARAIGRTFRGIW